MVDLIEVQERVDKLERPVSFIIDRTGGRIEIRGDRGISNRFGFGEVTRVTRRLVKLNVARDTVARGIDDRRARRAAAADLILLVEQSIGRLGVRGAPV